jgi:hypothetical protein
MSSITTRALKKMCSQDLTGAAKSELSQVSTSTPHQDGEDERKLNCRKQQDKLAHLRFQAAMVQALSSGDDKTMNSLAGENKSHRVGGVGGERGERASEDRTKRVPTAMHP